MAKWFIKTATTATGQVPDLVALLRWENGSRLEFPGLAEEFAQLGVDALEADPRELTTTRGGLLSLHGRTVRHAYWKLGILELHERQQDVGAVLSAIQDRQLFVQNGLAARIIGDNKLCLAILSDRAFESLFDPQDLACIRPHIPWSRNVGLCSAAQLHDIRLNPAYYVLKRPFDSRGRGVVIGRESDDAGAWERAVDLAKGERWLVQEFCATTRLATASHHESSRHHDLALAVADGHVVGALSRSSNELRTNVGQSGRLHPVFMEERRARFRPIVLGMPAAPTVEPATRAPSDAQQL